MTSFVRTLAPLLFVPALLVACSGGGGGSVGGGGSLTTSVPGSRQLTSLSQAEREQYCSDLTRYYSEQIGEAERKKATCASMAYATALGSTEVDKRQERCRTAYQECLAKPSTSPPRTLDSDECATSKIFSSCSATVSEVSACVQESVSITRSRYSMYDAYCDRFQADGGVAANPVSGTQSPASCSNLAARCPGLLDD